ncbi:hypothetical protein [Paenibacillus taichungensis]
MSKKEQFKGLLSESGDTGSQQKDRILSAHLLPLHSIEGNPTTQHDGHTKTDGKPDNEANKSDGVSGQSSESSQKMQDGNNPSGQPVIPAAPSASPTSGESHSPSFLGSDQSGITSLVSQLKNMNELKVEDTHTRMTYLIENELLAELKALSAGKKKGYKNKIVNTGIRIAIELMRQDNNSKP